MGIEKKLIDEVSCWMKVYDDGSVDRTWTGPPELKFMSDPVLPHENFIDGVAVRDVVTDARSGSRVRIYMPEIISDDTESALLPIILHFHGGGFCISQPDWYMYYHFYARLARESRAIYVSVFLRLAPENRLPSACDDAFNTLTWLQSLAQGETHEAWLSPRADFERVFLIGDSSGGNLVHEVATRAGKVDMNPVKLQGGILLHPGFCRAQRSKSELEQPESPLLTLEMVDKFLSLALPIGSNKDHPITCPMGVAAPPIHELTLPPLLLCLAENDLIWDPEMEYYEALKESGKNVELFTSPHMGHIFYLNKIAVDLDPETSAQTCYLINGIAKFINNR